MTLSDKDPLAIYELEIKVEFAGPVPERFNRAAPEVTPAHIAAVDAALDVLREHGFLVSHVSHGHLRTRTYLPSDNLNRR